MVLDTFSYDINNGLIKVRVESLEKAELRELWETTKCLARRFYSDQVGGGWGLSIQP